jgi:uncharacterized phage-associated protein
MRDARYKFSAEKAFAAIHWMVGQSQPLDLHAALKACYFSDKSHLNEHLLPIFGATYKAMKYGPVPLEIYEMMKGEKLWLWEIQRVDTPWIMNGHQLQLDGKNSPADISSLSESEMGHLESGLKKSLSMNFTARTAATHGPDWSAANGGRMRYEDMLEERENKAEILRSMQETARYAKL